MRISCFSAAFFAVAVSFGPSFIPITALADSHAGGCTGSANCRACTNCTRCAHCKGGGTCGVCAATPTPAPEPAALPDPAPQPVISATVASAKPQDQETAATEAPDDSFSDAVLEQAFYPISTSIVPFRKDDGTEGNALVMITAVRGKDDSSGYATYHLDVKHFQLNGATGKMEQFDSFAIPYAYIEKFEANMDATAEKPAPALDAGSFSDFDAAHDKFSWSVEQPARTFRRGQYRYYYDRAAFTTLRSHIRRSHAWMHSASFKDAKNGPHPAKAPTRIITGGSYKRRHYSPKYGR